VCLKGLGEFLKKEWANSDVQGVFRLVRADLTLLANSYYFICQIALHTKNVKTDDTSTIRGSVYEFVYPGRSVDPPFRCKQKSDRGLNHPEIARLFCPARHMDEYDHDSSK
jgi:hypothetical protein